MRASGILLPITSLPSKYGIGSFSKEAYEFIDQLKAAGQRYWQILPLGPTGYGDSPYQSFSTFAGNPYNIDVEEFVTQGILTLEECKASNTTGTDRYIEYGELYILRFELLKTVFSRVCLEKEDGFQEFCNEEEWWLDDYASYMAIKDSFDGISFIEWPEDIRNRERNALYRYKEELNYEIQYYKFLQFKFYQQWNKLKKYANQNEVKIIGDIPIYVAFDSADTWANPELFQFDENGLPTAVAGCPPDGFSETGQLWGNPLYKWEYHKETKYQWWIKRIAQCYKLYDVIRIDHFRGFDEYYSIPYGNTTAIEGEWKQGPGYEIFEKIKEQLGELNIIAEDLGFLTPGVLELVDKTGYPGMKILQFAFDSREESDYLPHNYNKNCVVYTGTHDNDTTLGWYRTISKEDREFAQKYLGVNEITDQNINELLIRLAMASVADTCIIPIQDFLDLGSQARINVPSTLGYNWKWRLLEKEIKPELIDKIGNITKIYGRK